MTNEPGMSGVLVPETGSNFRCLLNVGRLRVEPAGARYGRAVLALGVVAAVGASALYNTSIALQALEAREVPHVHTLRPSLLGRLVRNRRWLVATAVGLLGWPLEIAALLLAPLTVVQPCVASGLILLLWLGATRLGEKPGPREAIAVAAVVVGVAGIAVAAPARTTDHADTGAIALALVLVAIPILAPYLWRRLRPPLDCSPSSAPAAVMPGRRWPPSWPPMGSRPGPSLSRSSGLRAPPLPRGLAC